MVKEHGGRKIGMLLEKQLRAYILKKTLYPTSYVRTGELKVNIVMARLFNSGIFGSKRL